MTVSCDWCGREFEPTNRRGPVPRYCSRSHRQRAFEARRVERIVDEILARHHLTRDANPG